MMRAAAVFNFFIGSLNLTFFIQKGDMLSLLVALFIFALAAVLWRLDEKHRKHMDLLEEAKTELGRADAARMELDYGRYKKHLDRADELVSEAEQRGL